MFKLFNIIIFFGILTSIYFILIRRKPKRIREIINEIKGDEVEKKNISIKIPDRMKKVISFKITREKLDQYGNPFNLTPVTYVMIKVLMPTVAFLSMKSRFDSFIAGIISGILGFFFIDYIYYRSNNNDLNDIRLDLGDVYDLLALQTGAGAQLGIALSEAYTVAKASKRFQKALVELAATINLTANIDKALDNFSKKFNFTEIHIFVSSMKQAQETGLTEQILNGQGKQIKRKNVSYIQKKTNRIDTKIMILVLLVFFGAIALVILALSTEMTTNMSNMFS